jgi:hypothetical protein
VLNRSGHPLAFWAFAARHRGLALTDLSCGQFRAWKTR